MADQLPDIAGLLDDGAQAKLSSTDGADDGTHTAADVPAEHAASSPPNAQLDASSHDQDQGDDNDNNDDDDDDKAEQHQNAGATHAAASHTSAAEAASSAAAAAGQATEAIILGPSGAQQVQTESEDGEISCSCRKPWGGRAMIECDKCKIWYHNSCVFLADDAVLQYWACPNCDPDYNAKRKKAGPAPARKRAAAEPTMTPEEEEARRLATEKWEKERAEAIAAGSRRSSRAPRPRMITDDELIDVDEAVAAATRAGRMSKYTKKTTPTKRVDSAPHSTGVSPMSSAAAAEAAAKQSALVQQQQQQQQQLHMQMQLQQQYLAQMQQQQQHHHQQQQQHPHQQPPHPQQQHSQHPQAGHPGAPIYSPGYMYNPAYASMMASQPAMLAALQQQHYPGQQPGYPGYHPGQQPPQQQQQQQPPQPQQQHYQ